MKVNCIVQTPIAWMDNLYKGLSEKDVKLKELNDTCKHLSSKLKNHIETNDSLFNEKEKDFIALESKLSKTEEENLNQNLHS